VYQSIDQDQPVPEARSTALPFLLRLFWLLRGHHANAGVLDQIDSG
jgi:hypothetical protein